MFRFIIPKVISRRKKSLSFRKKRNTMKDKDRFAITKTGEKPLNEWFTKPRIQKMLREIERLRNVNRHTIKLNQKTAKAYAEQAEQHSDLMLHRYLAEYEEIKSNQDAADQVKQESLTLPYYLSSELTTDSSLFTSNLEDEFLIKYFPQYIKVLPPKMAENAESLGNAYEVLAKDPSSLGEKPGLNDS